MPSSRGGVFGRILEVIRAIPKGKVMTYGQVARAAGLERGARTVGYALRAQVGDLPWQRVVGQRGPDRATVSIPDPIGAAMQRRLLRKEGVRFGRDGTIDLARYGAAPGLGTKRSRNRR